MDKETKAKLDKMLAEDVDKRTAAKTTQQAKIDEAAEFEKAFLSHREETIVPAMEEFANSIAGHGWTARVILQEPTQRVTLKQGTVQQNADATLEFTHTDYASRDGSSSGKPHFSVVCDKHSKDAYIHQSTIGPGHGGSGGGGRHFQLKALTHDAVLKQLVEYFGKLLHDARPPGAR